MKGKEQIVTAAVMCIVSVMVIIGFTVAWYRINETADVTGLELTAAELGDIRIALESGGRDISELTGDDQYVEIGLEELTNISVQETDENGETTTVYQMAPGAYGDVTFYVTPLEETVTACSVACELILKDGNGTEYTLDNGKLTLDDGTLTRGINLYDHIVVYYYADDDTQQTNPILLEPTSDDETKRTAAYALSWDREKNQGVERPVVLYWKWYYEDPEFETALAQALSSLTSEAAKKAKETELRGQYEQEIDTYDIEDTEIGNHIESVQFHFQFSAS